MPFFLLKGLSFLPGGSLLKNPKVLLALIILIALVIGYFKFKGALEERIYNEIINYDSRMYNLESSVVDLRVEVASHGSHGDP